MRKITVTYELEDDVTHKSYTTVAIYSVEALEQMHKLGDPPMLVKLTSDKAGVFWESVVGMGFTEGVLK